MILFLHNPVRASGCGVTLYIEVSVCVVSHDPFVDFCLCEGYELPTLYVQLVWYICSRHLLHCTRIYPP